jgi:site-specific recombinase XerD
MDALLVDFQTFLTTHTNLSAQSAQSYKKDLAEFLEYLAYTQSDLKDFTGTLLQDYLTLLKKRQLGTATALRKSHVLKLLCTYLHTQYNLPDYSSLIVTDKSLPFLCSPGIAQALLKQYKNKTFQEYQQIPYKELRNFIMLYLLSYTSLNINKLVALKKDDFFFDNHTLRYTCLKTGTKTLDLSPSFFIALAAYIGKVPFESEYLFAVKSGNTIKPLPHQAARALVKAMLEDPTHKRSLPESSTQLLDDDIKDLYKKHPRS